jgi:hypothetical protein
MDKFRCPHCNNLIEVHPAGADFSLFETKTPTRFPHTTTGQLPPGSRASRETPVEMPTGETIQVRLSEAVISGAIIGAVVGPGSLIVTYLLDFGGWAMAGTCFALGGIGLIGGVAYTWFGRAGHYDALLWRVEEITGLDINRDGDVGEPLERRVTLEVFHKDERGSVIRTQIPELHRDITLDLFARWCVNIAGGWREIKEDDWVGRGKPFNKTAYREMLATLAEIGVIKKDGDHTNAKWVVTPGQAHTLGRWAQLCEAALKEEQDNG